MHISKYILGELFTITRGALRHISCVQTCCNSIFFKYFNNVFLNFKPDVPFDEAAARSSGAERGAETGVAA